ncbi:MAG: Sec-independent protein translocase subunit TatA/TatB [Candidatus Dormibacteraceae bacterium]
MPFDLHPIFLIVVVAVALILFGPGKLPEVGGAIGRGIREFRQAASGIVGQNSESTNAAPPTTPTEGAEPPVDGDSASEHKGTT